MKNLLFSEKRKIIFSLIFSILFSTLQVIGYNCFKYDSANLNKISTYLWIIIITLITYVITNLIYNIPIIKNKKNKIDLLFGHKYSFLIILVLILIGWLPIFIILYPGVFTYDVGTQIRMLQFDVITKYHPVLHTMFIGIIYLGHKLFNSWSLGLLLHSIIQMIIMASIFSYTLTYLYKKKVPNYLLLFFLCLYMFLPTHSVFSITTTKDILFSGIFNLVLICYIELFTNTDKFFTKKNYIITIILTFLLIAFRNNMLYAFIVFIPFVLLFLKKYFKKLAVLFLSILAIVFVYDKTLTYVFKIENGPRVEMFSFVVQQFARTYHKDNLSNEDKTTVENLFLNDSLKNYNSHISDPVKSNFNTEELLGNKSKYIKLYTHLLLNNPNTFIDSVLNNTYSFYYLFDKLPDPETKTYIELNCLEDNGDTVNRTDKCNYNKNIIYRLVVDADYQRIPILDILMNMAFYFIVLLFVSIYTLYKKNYKLFFPLLLLILYMGTNMLAPVALVRYAYPLFTTFPILIYIYHQTKKDYSK